MSNIKTCPVCKGNYTAPSLRRHMWNAHFEVMNEHINNMKPHNFVNDTDNIIERIRTVKSIEEGKKEVIGRRLKW